MKACTECGKEVSTYFSIDTKPTCFDCYKIEQPADGSPPYIPLIVSEGIMDRIEKERRLEKLKGIS